MTYKEASEIILKHKDMINNTFPNSIMAEENTEALSMAIIALKQQEKERWFPVSEGLPEVPTETEDEHCPYFNVTFLNGVVNTLQFTSDGCSWFDEDGDVYNDVIAWKPMPEEYKGERKW